MKRLTVTLATGLLILASPAAEAFAASGGLDAGFGPGGAAITNTGGDDYAYAAALQRDGKIVVAGYTTDAIGNGDVLVYRLNADGSPDRSFDGDGRFTTGGAGDQRARALAVAPDGKIVVAGYTAQGVQGTTDAVVYRLTPSGSLDTSFDGDGTTTIHQGGDENARGLALRPDGKIVVAGYTSAGVGGLDDASVYRLLPNGGAGAVNGALDPSFDYDGAARIDSGGLESANALALQPDGRIVIAGYVSAGGKGVAAVYRLKPNGDTTNTVNGALDPSFDVDGAAGVDNGGSDVATALALQPDGKIVVAGYTSTGAGGTRDATVYRFKPNGGTANVTGDALDPSFDVDGQAKLDSGANEEARALALQPDGKFVIAGHSRASVGSSAAAIHRLRDDGAADRSFDGDGEVLITRGNPTATAVVIQPDRRLVVAGSARPAGGDDDAVVYRLYGDPFALAVEKSGPGTVASASGGIDCGSSCSRVFDVGTRLTLTATPAPDARFAGWSGGGCTGSGSCRLTLAGDTTVRASFAPAAFGRDAHVTLRLAKRRIRARGPVRVVVANANDFSVRGRLVAKASRSRRKLLELRARTLTLAANGRQTLRLKLPRALRRQLTRKRKLRLRMTATVTDPAGNTRTVKRRLSPRLARSTGGRR